MGFDEAVYLRDTVQSKAESVITTTYAHVVSMILVVSSVVFLVSFIVVISVYFYFFWGIDLSPPHPLNDVGATFWFRVVFELKRSSLCLLCRDSNFLSCKNVRWPFMEWYVLFFKPKLINVKIAFQARAAGMLVRFFYRDLLTNLATIFCLFFVFLLFFKRKYWVLNWSTYLIDFMHFFLTLRDLLARLRLPEVAMT